jgi:hypothetical protein
MLTIILAGQLQWHIWISHAVRVKRPWAEGEGLFESATITGQTAGNRDGGADHAGHAID